MNTQPAFIITGTNDKVQLKDIKEMKEIQSSNLHKPSKQTFYITGQKMENLQSCFLDE